MECPECGTDVSPDLETCPVCGGSLPDERGESVGEQGEPTSPGGQPGQGGPDGGQPTGERQQPQSGGQNQPTQGPPTGGQPTGGQPTQGPPNGSQPRQGAPGQGQPTQGPAGQPQHGQGSPGQPPQGPPGQSPQGQTGQGQPPQGGPAQPGHGQQRGRPGQSRGLGATVRSVYDSHLSDLPVIPGLVAGIVVFLVGLGICFGIVVAVTELLDSTTVVTFVPTVSIQAAGLLFFVVQFASPVPFGAAAGSVPAVLGALYVLVPWMLLVVGTRFARYYATDGDVVEHVLAGTTVTVGYLPAVALGGILLTSGQLFPPAYGNLVFTAGILYPVLVGGFGGLLEWFLDDYAGFVPKLTGFGASLLVFLLVVGVTAGVGGSAVQSSPLALVVLSVLTFVGSQAFTFSGGGAWAVVYLVPLLVLLVVGYVRGRRAGAVESLDGVRAGSSVAFGYGFLVFLTLISYSVVSTFGNELADYANDGGFTTLSNVVSMGGPNILFDPMSAGPAFLFWFAIAGVVYPFTVSGLGGLLASVRASSSPTEAPDGQPPQEGYTTPGPDAEGPRAEPEPDREEEPVGQTNESTGQSTGSTDSSSSGGGE